MGTRWLVALGLCGLGLVGWLVWAWERTEPPGSLATVVFDLIAVVGLAVAPWLILTARRLNGDTEARGTLGRVVVHAGVVAATGIVLGVVFTVIFRDEDHLNSAVAGFSILLAGLIALLGGVLFPWLFVLTRAVTRERAARVRAEARADVAAHLHDTVLQALTLIQKRTAEPDVLRLARGSERELRAWLYGSGPADADDLADAVKSVVSDVEDQYVIEVELITVGTHRLDPPARAVVGALREALTNAARHAGVRRVSVFVEVGEGAVSAMVRDRGRGFDPARGGGPDRRGIPDSIDARMRHHGGTATIRSTVGEGTEVELHMPVGR
jgi:signal transduction histidine kinase